MKGRKRDLELSLAPKRSRKDWRKEQRRQNFWEGFSVGSLIGILIGILLGITISFVLRHSDNSIVSAKSDLISTETEEMEEIETETEVEVERKVTYEELIAEHSIDNPASGRDRNINMRQAASDINKANNILGDGYILKSGEKFSWLEIVGNPTEARGYKRAGEMEKGGKSTTGIGGGVCQVSSTINSAIQKTSQSLEEECFHAEKHSGKIRYLKPERGDKEATVTYNGGRDFWFKSTLDYPIRIFIETEDDKVTVKIFAIKTRIVKEKKIKKIKKEIRKGES